MVKYVLMSLGVAGLVVLGVTPQGSGPTSQQERFIARVPQDFPTIQAAIDAVAEGGTVLIGPGTYQENLKISKSLRLKGASQESVRIRAVDHESITIDVAADRPIQVFLEDFTVETRESFEFTEFFESTGIRVRRAVQAVMERLTVSGFKDGVVLNQPLAAVLSASTISRNHTGIFVDNVGLFEGINVIIQDATITDNFHGIYTHLWVGHLVVRRSVLSRNSGAALHLLGGWLGGAIATLEENQIAQNRVGVYLWFDRNPDIELLLESQNQPEPGPRVMIVYKNQIVRNELYGIALLTEECDGISLPGFTTRRGNAFIEFQNEIRDNGKGDLCPADYPWPPGFRK